MPVPSPNLYPDFNIVRLSHVEFVVKDIAASRAFYADLLGLQITHEEENEIFLRALEERGHHCVILRKGELAEANVLGFKVYSTARRPGSPAATSRRPGSSVRSRGGPCAPATISAFH